jgi:hypothetical protein
MRSASLYDRKISSIRLRLTFLSYYNTVNDLRKQINYLKVSFAQRSVFIYIIFHIIVALDYNIGRSNRGRLINETE